MQPLVNASYEMTYSGRGCGIAYLFASPYTYQLDRPSKSTSKATVYEDESYQYTISQYVPNNYYSSALNFIENAGGRYNSFVISDALDRNLNINTNAIKVTNENGQDRSSYFNINISNNMLTATATTNALNSTDFYAHLYKVIIPVSVKSDTGKSGVGSIFNSATTTARNNKETETRTSNSVNVSLKYRMILYSIIDRGIVRINNGSSTSSNITYNDIVSYGGTKTNTVSFEPSYGYKVETVTIDGNPIPLDRLTQNNGVYSYTFYDPNVNQNITHRAMATTALKDTSVHARYVDMNGNSIANTETINGKVFDSYATRPKQIHGYTLTGTPTNATGQMTEETITVTYVYRPYQAQVSVSKIDDNTGRIVTKENTTFALYEWQASSNTWVAPTHIDGNTINGTVSDGKGAILKEKTSGTKGTYAGTVYYDITNQGKFKIVEYTRPWGYTTSYWESEWEVTRRWANICL